MQYHQTASDFPASNSKASKCCLYLCVAPCVIQTCTTPPKNHCESDQSRMAALKMFALNNLDENNGSHIHERPSNEPHNISDAKRFG